MLSRDEMIALIDPETRPATLELIREGGYMGITGDMGACMALNDACKRDYAAAASEAFRIAGFDMGQVLRAEEAADEVMAALGALDITVSRLATPVRTLS